MSYSSVPTEPENATTAIQGRRYSSDTPTRISELPSNDNDNDNSTSNPPLPGAQLRRSSKIRHLSGEVKRKSIVSKYFKINTINPEDKNAEQKPQQIKIVMPL